MKNLKLMAGMNSIRSKADLAIIPALNYVLGVCRVDKFWVTEPLFILDNGLV